MKLISCHVTGFGKLSGFDYSFEDGIGVLIRENGWGKTTFAAFIKAMFYGLPRSTKQKLDENERKKYTPWSGGVFGGELVFAVGEKEYRVERTFGDQDTFHLYDTRTEQECFDYSEALGDELFGINAAAYERSTFFPQYETGKSDAQTSITAKLNGLMDAESDINAYDHAIAKLDVARKRYKLDRGIGGELDELNQRRNELLRKKQEAENASERLGQEMARQEKGKIACDEMRQSLEQAEKEYGEAVKEKSELDRLNHYKHIVAQVSMKEQECKAERAFFGEELPKLEEIEEIKQVEATIGRLEGELSAIDLSALEGSASKFDVIPTQEESYDLRECAIQADKLWTKLKGMKQITSDEHELNVQECVSLEEGVSQVLPTYEEIERDRRLAEEEKSNAEEERDEFLSKGVPVKKSGGSVLFLLLGILLSALGVASYFLYPMIAPIAIVGIAFVIVGIVCSIVEKKKYIRAKQAYEQEEERLSLLVKQTQTKLSEVWTLLDRRRRYDDACRRREFLIAEIATYEEFQGYLDELKEVEAVLTPLGLRRGETFIQAWMRYEETRKNAIEYRARKAKKEGKEGQIEEERKKVTAFVEKYHATADEAKSHLSKYEFYWKEWERAKESKVQFEAEHQIDESYLEKVFVDKTEDADAKRKYFRTRLDSFEAEYRKICNSITLLSEQAGILPDIEAELASLEERNIEAYERYQTLAKTKKYLEQAKESLTARYQDKLKNGFADTFALFDGGKIGERFTIDTEQNVKFRADGQTQKVESLSKGWRSIVALTTRFAYVEALFPEEKPFLILDDPFSDLDGENFRTARELLEKLSKRYQILYLICHESRS